MFFNYIQNNTGGSFDFDEKEGITHHVIIEAENADAADSKAEGVGLYWNGCEDGNDCSCCGDRWYPARGDDGTEAPTIYGEPVNEADFLMTWMADGKEAVVHYADGHIEWVGQK